MDRRYFLIIIIIIVCSFSLYNIAVNSDVVGSASVECGKYTCSIPNGFFLYNSEKTEVTYSDGNGMYIFIYTSLTDSANYTNKIDEIENSSDYTLLSNGTINNTNLIIHSIYYVRGDGVNRSTFYFTKYDNNFKIIISGFDYDTERNKTVEMASSIANSIKFNYKRG
jgi:hypothetical protein